MKELLLKVYFIWDMQKKPKKFTIQKDIVTIVYATV